MDFINLLIAAKSADLEATKQLLDLYSPMLYHEAVIEGVFDEDLMQELQIVLLNCIQKFYI